MFDDPLGDGVSTMLPYIEQTAANAAVYAEAPVDLFDYPYSYVCDGNAPTYVGFNAFFHQRQERAASGKPARMTTASGQSQEADGDRARYRTCAK